jgi:hypothetical protein
MPEPRGRRGVRVAAVIAAAVHLTLWVVLYFMAMDMWGSAPAAGVDTFGGRADIFALAISLWAGSGILALVAFLAGLARTPSI